MSLRLDIFSQLDSFRKTGGGPSEAPSSFRKNQDWRVLATSIRFAQGRSANRYAYAYTTDAGAPTVEFFRKLDSMWRRTAGTPLSALRHGAGCPHPALCVTRKTAPFSSAECNAVIQGSFRKGSLCTGINEMSSNLQATRVKIQRCLYRNSGWWLVTKIQVRSSGIINLRRAVLGDKIRTG
jgi:hypothetical protein